MFVDQRELVAMRGQVTMAALFGVAAPLRPALHLANAHKAGHCFGAVHSAQLALPRGARPRDSGE